jgi:DNA-directed RNA polymerase subunit beta
VLLKEMQSLALDVKVVSVDGGDVAVREEEDELLRAAEELGIDLRPVADRAAARQPEAQELEEGVDRNDEDGELTVPNDELLGEELVEDDLDGESDDDGDGDDDDEGGFGDIADLELVEEGGDE